MKTNYDSVAKTFAQSRRGMSWPEIDEIMKYIRLYDVKTESILDIWCGSGRLLESLQKHDITWSYLWIDVSSWLIDEAAKDFPENAFRLLDMKDVSSLEQKFDCVFLIASFHHLQTYEERQQVLRQLQEILCEGGYVFFLNWYLIGWQNSKKYHSSIIKDSFSDYGSQDYSIKIGKSMRFYHWFSLSELEKLADETSFELVLNSICEGERNILTILRK